MDQPIVTGILAYGMSGKIFHAPFLHQHPGFVLKAVLERNQKSARNDYPEITSYDSLEEILKDPTLELLVINTPNNTHFELAKKALRAGKHVLIEKPATTTVAEARELFNLGRQTGKKVLIYQNRRWSSDFLATKQVIESKRLGKIVEMHLRFDRYRNFIGPKTFKETAVPGSGFLFDLGAHLLDQAIAMYGRPIKFYKTLGRYRQGTEVDDYGHLHLVYPEQLNVFITVSMLVAEPQPGIIIHGTKGSFIKGFCDMQEEQLQAGMFPDDDGFGFEKPESEGLLSTFNANGDKTTEKIASEKGDYMGLFETVFQTIRQGKDYPVTEDQIIAQLEILELIEQ